MRTNIFLPVLSILIIASACQPKTYPAASATVRMNQLIRDAQGNPDLYGKSTEEGMKQPPFSSWYLSNYNGYTPDNTVLNFLRPALRNKTIQIFMATWCGDSKREVPRMLKVLNLCGVPPTAIEIINVGRGDHDYKQSPTHEERGKNIHRVPTFIVYQDGKELNRIVEFPVQSLEKDLLRILQQEAYLPKYQGAAWMLQWYGHPAWEQHEHDSTILAADLRKIILSRSELDGLGKLQLSLQEINKALFTLKLNSMLFPEEPLVLRSFSKALLRKGDTSSANHYLEKAERYVRQ
jgi:thiol-disulfide isomerase/thioredoxin